MPRSDSHNIYLHCVIRDQGETVQEKRLGVKLADQHAQDESETGLRPQ